MHELSIAVNIVEIVEEEVSKSGAKRVDRLELEIGTLSGIIQDALEFALESAIQNTVLEGADIRINMIQGKAKCLDCNTIYSADDLFTFCPKCQSFQNQILNGKELKIKSLIVE